MNIKLPSQPDISASDIHSPFAPEEIRENDVVKCSLKMNGVSIDCQVFRYSPLGVELLILEDRPLQKGDNVNLNIIIGGFKKDFSGLIVDNITNFKGKPLVAIRFFINTTNEWDNSSERRYSKRWSCSPDFYPAGVAPNPVKYNDFIYFKVLNISSTGFKISTSLRNKFICKGMTLNTTLNFPMVSQLNVKISIENVRIESIDNREYLILGCTYQNSDKLQECLSNYLYQFSDCTNLSELREAGYKIRSVSGPVQFSFVKTEDEYNQVLDLRYQCYSQANKTSFHNSPKDFADIYDTRSRIVIGKFKGEVVCSARVIFNEQGNKMEHEADIILPNDFPIRSDIVELSRACTRPDFKNTELLLELFKYLAVVAAQGGRKWVLISSDEKMIDLYDKLGFKRTGIKYNLKALNNIQHEALLCNMADAMRGIGINPIYWNIVWRDVYEYIDNFDLTHYSTNLRWRRYLYSCLNPLSSYLFRKVKKKK